MLVYQLIVVFFRSHLVREKRDKQSSSSHSDYRGATWLEEKLVEAKIDLKRIESSVNCTLLANTTELKLMSRRQLCMFMSGFKFLTFDLPSLDIYPCNLDTIVRNSLRDIEVGYTPIQQLFHG